MKKIFIEKTKGIKSLEFIFPDQRGVYLLVGANGTGKTTLLTCMERICNPLAFARGFTTSRSVNEVDQFEQSSITYSTDGSCIRFRKRTAKWVPTPKNGSSELLHDFGYPTATFIHADSKRFEATSEDLRAGNFVAADAEIKNTLNSLLETDRYSRLMRLRNAQGRGRQAAYYYVIKEGPNKYYSEKRFSTGELALLRLVEQLGTAENGALVLLDEAEMALHPRVQINLIKYLNEKASEKEITVFVSTHSPAMIKAMQKERIIMLEDVGNGEIKATIPCYPAKAMGCVDFESSTIFDYIFFVEDDMARLILKKLLNRYIVLVPTHATALSSIIPVGGFEQTAEMAVRTREQVFSQSHVFALVDQDAFEDIDAKPKFKELYNAHSEFIRGLGFTPEVWLIQQLEGNTDGFSGFFRERFHCELMSILHSSEYTDCNSRNQRQLAKDRFAALIGKLSATSGDSDAIVKDCIIQKTIDLLDDGEVKRLIGPLLRR